MPICGLLRFPRPIFRLLRFPRPTTRGTPTGYRDRLNNPVSALVGVEKAQVRVRDVTRELLGLEWYRNTAPVTPVLTNTLLRVTLGLCRSVQKGVSLLRVRYL